MPDSAPAPGSRYVALGSSFAAGPGVTPVVDRTALRSGRNYAHQVAATLRLDLVDVTSSGATTAHILATPQGVAPPQIDAVTPDAALVTVTAGGNDLGYVGTLLGAGALGTVVRRLPLTARWRERLGDLVGFRTTPAAAPEAYAAVAASQAAVVERVRERAPQARILLVDYLTLVPTPPPDADTVSLTPTQVRAAADVGQGLAEAFRSAAARSGAELVPASHASVSHGVGSPDPWVYGFEIGIPARGGRMPYHPNLAGMTEVARLVVDTLRRPPAPTNR